jgi:glycosyltransferase involved in cell wall biosynthesis
MRQGIPVMASVYTGAKEAVINGVTGYHFNPYNIDNSVNKIQMILNNPDLNKSMSLQSVKQFNENFTIDKCVNKYLKMIS